MGLLGLGQIKSRGRHATFSNVAKITKFVSEKNAGKGENVGW